MPIKLTRGHAIETRNSISYVILNKNLDEKSRRKRKGSCDYKSKVKQFNKAKRCNTKIKTMTTCFLKITMTKACSHYKMKREAENN